MNKYLFALAFLLSPGLLPAQSLEGAWQGILNAGKDLHVVFHLKQNNGRLEATMDSPDQGVTAIPCDSVIRSGDSLRITLLQGRAAFQGRLQGDTSIKGFWEQGLRMPLELHRTAHPVGLQRPQTPHPPFPYQSEEVTFYNADKSIRYGATLTLPAGKKLAPALLLITGSGPQNRDEEIFGHKPFAVIADYLTRKGYIVLRVDDRGVGQTTGDRTLATTLDFTRDAGAALDYLKSRREVDRSRMGLLGHSEGALIATMLAADRQDVSFIVLMAGPGIPILDLMARQGSDLLRTQGIREVFVEQYEPLYAQVIRTILDAPDSASAARTAIPLVHEWRVKNAEAAAALNIADDTAEHGFVQQYQEMLKEPWFHQFFLLNPQTYLRQLHCKVLAMNGEKDVQVAAKQNLAGIRESLAESKAKQVDIAELPGLNHLFQTCERCSVAEYGQISETISPKALQLIGDWLDKNVK